MRDRERGSGFLHLFFIASLVLSTVGGTSSSHAASKTRVFGTALFVAGVGMKFAGLHVHSNAQSIYDDYLTTAVQSEIAQRREDYRSKRRVGVTLSNTGNAFLVTGALLTAGSALRSTEAETSFSPRLNGNGVIFALSRRF